ncbi:MAG: NUDIX hydrolase [Bacteroidota bacterium]|jgi:8-oxo-dGTP pyrophosphatase MutT (NUDIX family)
MHRNPLLQKLHAYHPSDPHEIAMLQRIIAFVENHSDCFERSQLSGHITASALVVNQQRSHTLMTHHHKLEKWLQLGGHSDGDPNPLSVALREAEEESGIQGIVPISMEIFDVDVHPIPARKQEPEHFHYDIRFLFEADDAQALTITAESKDLAWIPLKQIGRYTMEESILRMVKKLNSFTSV